MLNTLLFLTNPEHNAAGFYSISIHFDLYCQNLIFSQLSQNWTGTKFHLPFTGSLRWFFKNASVDCPNYRFSSRLPFPPHKCQLSVKALHKFVTQQTGAPWDLLWHCSSGLLWAAAGFAGTEVWGYESSNRSHLFPCISSLASTYSTFFLKLAYKMMPPNWKCRRREKLEGGKETFPESLGRRRKTENRDDGGTKKKMVFVLNMGRN